MDEIAEEVIAITSNHEIEIEKNFKLIGGPGAGKTQFIINHIRNIVHNSKRLSKIKKIACITYTNTGVNTLIKRLKDMNYYVDVTTIHSFLYKNIVKPYLYILKDEYNFDFRKINGHEEVIPSYGLINEFLIETNQGYLVSQLKIDGLKKDLSRVAWKLEENKKFKLYVRKKGKRNKYSIKKETLIEYKKKLWLKGILSHDDILYLSYKILKKNELILRIMRAKFPYILVDEFQDTDPIQSEILRMISKEETTLGIIGDNCQAIYEFHGSDVKQFINFNSKNMKTYIIHNNNRSTQEIINVLNYLRKDEKFIQNSSDKKNGPSPCILIGRIDSAYEESLKRCANEELTVLAYKNVTVNKIKYGSKSEYNKNILDEIIFNGEEREHLLINTIRSLEYCKIGNMSEAIKYIKIAYRKRKDFDNKMAFILLKKMIDNYEEILKLDIKTFFNNYIYQKYNEESKIKRAKKYENVTYKKIVCLDMKAEKNYKSIHQAKGDEFNNVLLIIDPDKYKEERSLNFLLNPDLENTEEHRVYYEALSRAKKQLFINVPKLSNKLIDKITGFEIVELN